LKKVNKIISGKKYNNVTFLFTVRDDLLAMLPKVEIIDRRIQEAVAK